MPEEPNRFARELFNGLPARYDRLAELLSFGQNRQWRAEMVGHVVPADGVILDVASGTAGVALQLAARSGARVVGVDLTEPMLRQGQRRVAAAGLPDRISLAAGRAEQLPFPDASVDALTFTYLLRYVRDPQATLAELARVLKPGGSMASLEFCVPGGPLWHPAWWAYTRMVLPAGGLLLGGREWYRVGRFLGPNISAHYRRYPVAWTVEAWEKAGPTDVGTRVMSLGGGLVMWGNRVQAGVHPRPAYYAARPGAWRDWWTLLHPPYTAWHLSYVVIGAALAPRVLVSSLIATVLAFFLAVGLAAHALDELRGRPLRTAIPSAVLVAVVAAGLLGALVLGVFGVIRVGWTLIPFMVAGPVLVIAYNAELFGGLMHTDFGFAAAGARSRCSPRTRPRPARWPWRRCWPRPAPSRCPRPSAG